MNSPLLAWRAPRRTSAEAPRKRTSDEAQLPTVEELRRATPVHALPALLQWRKASAAGPPPTLVEPTAAQVDRWFEYLAQRNPGCNYFTTRFIAGVGVRQKTMENPSNKRVYADPPRVDVSIITYPAFIPVRFAPDASHTDGHFCLIKLDENNMTWYDTHKSNSQHHRDAMAAVLQCTQKKMIYTDCSKQSVTGNACATLACFNAAERTTHTNTAVDLATLRAFANEVKLVPTRETNRRKPLTPNETAWLQATIFNTHWPIIDTKHDFGYGPELYDKNLIKLRPQTWLNNNIIDNWFWCLQRRSRSDLFMPIIFSQQLRDNDPPLKKKGRNSHDYWWKNEIKKQLGIDRRQNVDNAMKKDRIFIAINAHHLHWVLAIAYVPQHTLVIYDSLNYKEHHEVKTKITKILEWLALVDRGPWKFEYKAQTPVQNNECDCGVFVCMTADYGADVAVPEDEHWIQYNQSDIPGFRNRIACRLRQGADSLVREEQGDPQDYITE